MGNSCRFSVIVSHVQSCGADTPNKNASYPEDSKPGTIHLGIFDEDKTLVATSTWVINPWQEDPNATAVQLRGMAVAVNKQSSGLGKILIDAGVAHAKSQLLVQQLKKESLLVEAQHLCMQLML